jgi:hypothetical protein
VRVLKTNKSFNIIYIYTLSFFFSTFYVEYTCRFGAELSIAKQCGKTLRCNGLSGIHLPPSFGFWNHISKLFGGIHP